MRHERAVAALSGLAVAGALTATAIWAAPAGAGSTAPRCRAAEMSAGLANPEGAAGSLYIKIVFRSRSGHRCVLAGRPGVSFVAGDDGHQVGSSARRNLDRPVVVVTLDPGERAKALLRISNQGNYPAARCKPKKARGLRVYPPGSFVAMYIPDAQTVCSSTVIRQMTIDPVRHG